MITTEVISDRAHDGIEMGTPPVQPLLRDGDLVLMAATTIAISSLYYCQPLLPILIVVPRNDEYCILKSFVEDTPGVPGLDIPGLEIVSNMLRS
jgi:hypothetical protein